VSSAIPGHPANPDTPVESVEALIPPVVYPAPIPQPHPINIDDLANTSVPGEIVETPGEVPTSEVDHIDAE
jgi:hypothetical protein